MMNKSLRARGRESSRKPYYGFQLLVIPGRERSERTRNPATVRAGRWIPGPREDACPGMTRQESAMTRRHKKEPPFPAAFEVDNREASNRVDRSHSVSKTRTVQVIFEKA